MAYFGISSAVATIFVVLCLAAFAVRAQDADLTPGLAPAPGPDAGLGLSLSASGVFIYSSLLLSAIGILMQ
ncbi:Hypothetical predicted protein [Olea europaea subsp. europaea]|uniref:Uncharacterized protein n=1 Tax=Olea europaea subsp. europaea TaxID=158383 RepID=A0A8S0SKA8_OLEEU|nr:Hypothetical predicted protein [Olea europaea subsp. europaea]